MASLATDLAASPDEQTALDPRPMGWFAVALSRELGRGQALQGELCAGNFQLRRDKDGAVTGYGNIAAVREQNGVILAWHDPREPGESADKESGHGAPTWFVPKLDETDWRPMVFKSLRIRTHPQEIYENSIDQTHFPAVHSFSGITVLQPPQFSDQVMSVRYSIDRKHPIAWIKKKVTPSFEVRLHGLGCAHNHVHLRDFGLRVRMFALATPTTPGHVHVRLGVSLHKQLKWPLGGLLAPLVHWGIAKNIASDFAQDVPIWESKRYVSSPLLVKGDGSIHRFRQWCQQFYGSLEHKQ